MTVQEISVTFESTSLFDRQSICIHKPSMTKLMIPCCRISVIPQAIGDRQHAVSITRYAWLSHVVARNVHVIHVAIMSYIYDVFIRCAHPYGVCLATAEEAEPCDMWDMLDKLLKRIPNPVR